MSDWRDLTLDAERALTNARRTEEPRDRERWLTVAEIKIQQAKQMVRRAEAATA